MHRDVKNEILNEIILEKIKASILTKQVNLSNQEIPDDVMPYIIKQINQLNPKVEHILLKNNKISDIGAKVLAEGVVSLPNLVLIDLQSNKLGEAGFKALFELKEEKPNLMILLNGNTITNTGDALKLEQESRPSFKL